MEDINGEQLTTPYFIKSATGEFIEVQEINEDESYFIDYDVDMTGLPQYDPWYEELTVAMRDYFMENDIRNYHGNIVSSKEYEDLIAGRTKIEMVQVNKKIKDQIFDNLEYKTPVKKSALPPIIIDRSYFEKKESDGNGQGDQQTDMQNIQDLIDQIMKEGGVQPTDKKIREQLEKMFGEQPGQGQPGKGEGKGEPIEGSGGSNSGNNPTMGPANGTGTSSDGEEEIPDVEGDEDGFNHGNANSTEGGTLRLDGGRKRRWGQR